MGVVGGGVLVGVEVGIEREQLVESAVLVMWGRKGRSSMAKPSARSELRRHDTSDSSATCRSTPAHYRSPKSPPPPMVTEKAGAVIAAITR